MFVLLRAVSCATIFIAAAAHLFVTGYEEPALRRSFGSAYDGYFTRVPRSAPKEVDEAFLDADAMAKRLPPHGYNGKVHHAQAEVGGTCKPPLLLLVKPVEDEVQG